MSRHQRSWRVFLEHALQFDDYEQLYYGVCFLNKSDRVEYSSGCFRDDQVFIGIGGMAEPLDGAQFRRALEQFSRVNILQSTLHTEHNHERSSAVSAATSIRLGAEILQVVATSFTSLCAVSHGQRLGVVARRLSFGVLVVAFRAPHTLKDVAPVVERCCLALR